MRDETETMLGGLVVKGHSRNVPQSPPPSERKGRWATKYGDASNFLNIFHVSRQAELTHDASRCIFGDAPTLSQVNATYGRGTTEEWLTYQLWAVSRYAGIDEKLAGVQVQEMAKLIVQTWHWLKVSEMMLFFRRFKTGRYGQFYGRFDPLILMAALREFIRERNEMYARRETEDMMEADRRMRAEAVPMDEVRKRLASGQYPNLKKFLDRGKPVTVYFKINDAEHIRKVMMNLGIVDGVNVNGEAKCLVRDDKMMQMLKQAEQDGIIQIRRKEDEERFAFPAK